MASDSEESTYSDHSLDLDPDIEIEIISESLIKFATELYLALKMRANHSTNLVCSPLFTSSMLAGLKTIAVGSTAEEIMKHVFPGVLDVQQLEVGLKSILDLLDEWKKKLNVNLNTTARLFLQERMNPKFEYVDKIKRCFKMDVSEFDYVHDDWKTFSDVVKTWALESTSNQIGSIFHGHPGIDIDTRRFRLVSISLVHFKGDWVYPFNRKFTESKPFFLDENRSVDVPMMKSSVLHNVMYVPMRKLDCQTIVLPYKGESLCLVLFIPNERTGLSKIELKMDTISPKKYFEEMRIFRNKMSKGSGVRVELPKFAIESTMDLTAPLQELGVDLLFKKGRGEYGPFVDDISELHVSQICQKVVFHVSETGNEKIKSFTREAPPRDTERSEDDPEGHRPSTPPEIIELAADHPFYFQVVDLKLDILVLSGCCKNPLIKDFAQSRYSNLVREYHTTLSSSPDLLKQKAEGTVNNIPNQG